MTASAEIRGNIAIFRIIAINHSRPMKSLGMIAESSGSFAAAIASMLRRGPQSVFSSGILSGDTSSQEHVHTLGPLAHPPQWCVASVSA